MYCPECGMLNDEGRRYCIQCGIRLDVLASNPPDSVEHSADVPDPKEDDSPDAASVSDNPYEGLSDEDYDISDDEDEASEDELDDEERLIEEEPDEHVDSDEPEYAHEQDEGDDLEENDEDEPSDVGGEPESESDSEGSDGDDRDSEEENADDSDSDAEPEEGAESEESVEEVLIEEAEGEDQEPERDQPSEGEDVEAGEKEKPVKQLADKLVSKIAEKKADLEQRRQEKLEQQELDAAVPHNVYEQEPIDKKTIIIACVVALVVLFGITQVILRVNDGSGSRGAVVSEDAPVVYFESGGADGGAMTPLRVEADQQVTVPKCGYIYTGHSFLGWRDPDAHLLVPGSLIRVANDITLTAVWDNDQRAISFDAAGGDGMMASVHVPRGISFTVPKCSFIWDGHFFSYWTTNSGVTYLPGDVLIVDGDLELTAVWDAVGYKGKQVAEVEEAPEVGVLSPDTLPNMWSGSFEVHSDAVEGGSFWRSVVIEFSEHNADGLVAGAVNVGVLDDVPGAASGSYFFEGIIDWQTGHIEMVGTGWADQGTLTDMGGFRGTVDPNTNTMSGEWFDPNNIVLPGLWQVAAM